MCGNENERSLGKRKVGKGKGIKSKGREGGVNEESVRRNNRQRRKGGDPTQLKTLSERRRRSLFLFDKSVTICNRSFIRQLAALPFPALMGVKIWHYFLIPKRCRFLFFLFCFSYKIKNLIIFPCPFQSDKNLLLFLSNFNFFFLFNGVEKFLWMRITHFSYKYCMDILLRRLFRNILI